MSVSNRTTSWWAVSSGRARLTALGAFALVLALLTTSVVVWISPANPVNLAIANAAEESSAERAIVQERNKLLGQVIALREDLADSRADLGASKAETAVIQKALWSAQGELDAQGKPGARGDGAAKAPTVTKPRPRETAATPTVTVAGITAPSKAEIVAPASPYFGMFTEQAPFNWATFDSTAAKIGRTPSVVGYFGGWDESFRANAVTRAWERNTLPILTWESRPIGAANNVVDEPVYSLPAIIGDPAAGVPGTFDDYLRQYARDIVSTGLPLGIRLNHEMNGVWYPWAESTGSGASINGNRPGDYVKMWHHVHDIFEAEGAGDLVVWIWSPDIINRLPASHKTPEYLARLYPGDDYVDWVGLSGYLRPPYDAPEGTDYDFDFTFTPSLDALRHLTGKPIFLSEIGASEVGGHKADWVSSLFTSLQQPENADILGFAWFSLAITTYIEGKLGTNDWRIDSRADSLAAFTRGFSLPGSRFVLAPK